MYARQTLYKLSYILSNIHIHMQVNVCVHRCEQVNVEAQSKHCLPQLLST